jgi:hypothetical protein
VGEFKFLATIVTNENLILEKIKRRFVFLYALCKGQFIIIMIYKNIIFLAVLYGCDALSLTFRKEHRLRVIDNRVMKRIFGLRRERVKRVGEGCIMRSFISFILSQI